MKNTSKAGHGWAQPSSHKVLIRPPLPLRFLALLPVTLVGFMLFGFSYLISDEPRTLFQPGAGFATVAGQEVALLPYQRVGSRGMVQLITQDEFQLRLAAVDLETGRARWDVQLSGEPSWQARVLASGERHTYLATDGGLLILDLATGTILSRDSVTPAVRSRAACGFDGEHKAIVAMDANGGLHTIALDTTTATPATPEITAAWRGKLNAKRAPNSTHSSSSTKAALGRDTLSLRERGSAPGWTLERRTANGRTTPVGDTVFHEAQIPLTPPPGESEPATVLNGQTRQSAAGGPAGLVVVHHTRDINATAHALSVISLDTGQITASLPVGIGSVRALTSPHHRTLLYAPDTESSAGEALAVIGLDGQAQWIEIGRPDYFGNPKVSP